MRHKQVWNYMICGEREVDTERNKGSSKILKYSRKKIQVWKFDKSFMELSQRPNWEFNSRLIAYQSRLFL